MATLAEARRRACKRWPYGCHAILSLVPIETQRVGTMSVDKHWRLYFNLGNLESLSADEAAATILHEVSHLLLKHHKRAERFASPQNRASWKCWNYAADFAVNSNLIAEGIQIGDDWALPAQAGLENDLTAEQYYRLLEELEREQPTQRGKGATVGATQPTASSQQQSSDGDQGDGDQGDGDQGDGDQGDGDQGDDGQGDDGQGEEGQPSEPGGCQADRDDEGEVGKGGGGSCADGRQRPWELGSPAESGVEGIKPHEADMLIREVAEKIAEKAQGKGRGGMRGWANDVLCPRVDPKTKLLRAVRKAVEFASGAGDYSYRRPNRRNPRPDMVLPSSVQPIPRVTVIVDTSGSMDQRDLGLPLGLIGKVLNGFRIRDGLRVICGDESVGSVGRVFSPMQVELAGGGGTDMRPLIEEAAQAKPQPGVIVVCTDGYTPWPSEPVGVPVVACITHEGAMDAVPKWMDAVCLQ